MKKQLVSPLHVLITAVLITVIVLSRYLPHGANFTPVAGIALLSGLLLADRRLALVVPVAGMLLSDLLIAGTYSVGVMLVVYLSFTLPVFWARKNWAMHLGLTGKLAWLGEGVLKGLAATVAFYLLSNLAVFVFTPMYTKSLSGLLQCYINALPFVRPILAANLIYAIAACGVVAAVPLTFKVVRKTV